MASSGANDPREMNDPRRAGGAAPSSATGMFSAGPGGADEVSEEDFFAQFRSGPQTAAVVAPAAPVRPVAPPVREVFVKPGGRAAAVPVVPAPVAPKQRPGEVTSFLMAMGAVEEAPPAVKAEPVKVEAPVAGVEEVRELAAPAVEEAGAFTRMFQASDLAPAAEVGEEKALAAAATGQVEKPSFTQLLKAITDQRPVVEAASPVVVAPVAAAEPVKVANINEILERLNRPRSAPPPPAPVGPAPETVAGKLQAFRASVAEVTPVEPVAAKAEPGAFTQFMAGVAPAPAGVVPAQAALLPQVAEPPVARAGSMTQLLQSLDKPREGAVAGSGAGVAPAGAVNVPAAKESSGFTEFFQSPLATPRREAERSPFEAPGVAPGVQGGGSFTQLMQALNQPQAGAGPAGPGFPAAPAAGPLFPAASPAFPAPAGGMGGPGEFTKLMQTLDGPAPAAAPPKPVAAPASVGVPGGATSIFAAPVAAAPVTPTAAGPSEYTQVISGSMLRDARAKAPVQPPAPIVPGAMQMPGFAMPGAPPPPPMPAMAAPPMPQMQMPGMAMPGMAPPAVPAPPAPPAKSTLQQYLPLIILANVLLVIVIVVILIFVLRAHK